MFYNPYAVASWCLGIIIDTIGHNETASKDRDAPNKITGINEFINVNINKPWAILPVTNERITHNML